MAGIHLHPHDVTDEGISKILELVGKMDDVDTIYPQVNTIFERNPSPAGDLPHNPVRPQVVGQGTFHADIDTRRLSPRLHQTVDTSVGRDADPLESVRTGVDPAEYQVVPWVNVMNGQFEGAVEANCVVDFRGKAEPHWLCPNGPDVVPMWSQVLTHLAETYGYTRFLIDRIRFPDWSGRELDPRNLLSCFCANCTDLLTAADIDVGALRDELETVAGLLTSLAFDTAVARLRTSPLVQRWIAFRQRSVTSLIERLVSATTAGNPGIALWLDLWPPAYAWLLGQDYRELTRHSIAFKHFPYHRLGGGADVQGFIEYFTDDPAEQEHAFRAFLRFFELDHDVGYRQFKQHGFPIEFVAAENAKARRLAQPGTRIMSGVQMWNLPRQELLAAVQATRASAGDDLIYYCFGWTDESLFGVD